MQLLGRFLSLFLVFLLPALPALADGPSRQVTPESTGDYVLDKNHAHILFSVKHLGFSDYVGRFNDFDARLRFDGTNPANSTLVVTVNPASVDTNNKDLETRLAGDGFFNVAKYAQIVFEATEIKPFSRTEGTITGNLTMLGVTRPITLNAVLNGLGPNSVANAFTIGFSATTTFRRSDWGMKALVPQVGDDVRLTISAEFNRKDAQPPAAPATGTAAPATPVAPPTPSAVQ